MSSFKKMSDLLDVSKFKPTEQSKIVSLPPSVELVELSQVRDTKSPLWQKACAVAQIRPIYQNASFETCNEIPRAIVDLGIRWVKSSRKTSLYLHGNTGSGKTYFSTAIFRYLVESGKYPWIIFKKSDDLDEELLTAIQEKDEKFHLEKYFEVPVLFIDDLGVERPTERIVRQYYSIIDRRVSSNLLTIITSNVRKQDLPLGDRTISRLEQFYSIEFPKRDLRKNIDVSF